MWLALAGRYGFEDLSEAGHLNLWIGAFIVVSAVTFRVFGLGRGMWRFASITDLRSIVLASTVAVLGFLIVMFVFNRLELFPRTAPLITWFCMIVLLGAPRLAYRALKDGGIMGLRPRDMDDNTVENVLIVGGASDSDKVIRSYGLERSKRYKVQGIIDPKPGKKGRNVRGIPIIGTPDELEGIVDRLSRAGIDVKCLIVASPRKGGNTFQLLAATAARLGLPLRRVADNALTGAPPDLQGITLDDLLGRSAVQLRTDEIAALIEDRVVLITGAGGSIGSEITRQVAGFAPKRIVLVDYSEYALYEIDQTLSREFPRIDRRATIADVRDRSRMRSLFQDEKPTVVFHAAALKHVPLVEQNVCEGVLTNVSGTRNVADTAVSAGVEAVVMISTDKAIRPTSVMGATKRIAEAYCQALDISGVRTRFITVRFGNVLGSTGSVVPLFKRQILAGGPITVTDPEMKRYFMTIREATELVLQAAANGLSHEEHRGRIFVLDMGEPVKIYDLARTMIALAGLRAEEDIKIVFTGLRQGEKLFEELFDKDEPTIPSGADGVFVASARISDLHVLQDQIERVEARARNADVQAVRALIAKIVPENAAGLSMENTDPDREKIVSIVGNRAN